MPCSDTKEFKPWKELEVPIKPNENKVVIEYMEK